jgi:hypothetical protein
MPVLPTIEGEKAGAPGGCAWWFDNRGEAMKPGLRAGISAALFLILSGVALAQPAGDWVLLGTRNAGPTVETDTIAVGPGQGAFDRLYLRVLENALNVLDMRVTYGNGAPDDIPIRALIPAGGNTRVIDLRGGDRLIDSIRLTYQHPPGGGAAVVEVYGQR